MTLAALLDELKEVDGDLWQEISDRTFSMYDDVMINAIVQGCIQRACERRGWGFIICNQVANVCTKTSTYASEIYDTPAEALLAAYIAAVWAEEMR